MNNERHSSPLTAPDPDPTSGSGATSPLSPTTAAPPSAAPAPGTPLSHAGNSVADDTLRATFRHPVSSDTPADFGWNAEPEPQAAASPPDDDGAPNGGAPDDGASDYSYAAPSDAAYTQNDAEDYGDGDDTAYAPDEAAQAESDRRRLRWLIGGSAFAAAFAGAVVLSDVMVGTDAPPPGVTIEQEAAAEPSAPFESALPEPGAGAGGENAASMPGWARPGARSAPEGTRTMVDLSPRPTVERLPLPQRAEPPAPVRSAEPAPHTPERLITGVSGGEPPPPSQVPGRKLAGAPMPGSPTRTASPTSMAASPLPPASSPPNHQPTASSAGPQAAPAASPISRGPGAESSYPPPQAPARTPVSPGRAPAAPSPPPAPERLPQGVTAARTSGDSLPPGFRRTLPPSVAQAGTPAGGGDAPLTPAPATMASPSSAMAASRERPQNDPWSRPYSGQPTAASRADPAAAASPGGAPAYPGAAPASQGGDRWPPAATGERWLPANAATAAPAPRTGTGATGPAPARTGMGAGQQPWANGAPPPNNGERWLPAAAATTAAMAAQPPYQTLNPYPPAPPPARAGAGADRGPVNDPWAANYAPPATGRSNAAAPYQAASDQSPPYQTAMVNPNSAQYAPGASGGASGAPARVGGKAPLADQPTFRSWPGQPGSAGSPTANMRALGAGGEPGTGSTAALPPGMDWDARVAYIQFGAYHSRAAVDTQIGTIEGQLEQYRQSYPSSSFGMVRLFTHRGQDGLYRIFGDHFNSAQDALNVCEKFRTDYQQTCFPVPKEAMRY